MSKSDCSRHDQHFGVPCVEGSAGRVGIPGGYQGGWTGRAIPGTTQHAARGGPRTAKRAPEALQGLEWVVLGPDVRGTAGHAPVPTLRARSAMLASLVQDPADSRLTANKGEIPAHFL